MHLLSLEPAPHYRKLTEGKVPLHRVSHEESHQQCIDTQSDKEVPICRHQSGEEIEEHGQRCVAAYATKVIMDGIFPLSDEIGEQHADTVTGHTCPSASHIAIDGNEQEIAQHDDSTTRQ